MTMTPAELDILHKRIDAASQYLEFGAGESTVYASNAPNLKRVDSVESSSEFIAGLIQSNASLGEAIDNGKLFFHDIDIGETRSWGQPANTLKKHLWPNYSLSVFRSGSEHDLVLVDGRFRVACTLNSILNTRDDCIIMIHDFWIRPEYQFLLRFLDTVEQADTLGVFRKKPVNNPATIQRLIYRYQYLPADRTIIGKVRRQFRKHLLNKR